MFGNTRQSHCQNSTYVEHVERGEQQGDETRDSNVNKRSNGTHPTHPTHGSNLACRLARHKKSWHNHPPTHPANTEGGRRVSHSQSTSARRPLPRRFSRRHMTTMHKHTTGSSSAAVGPNCWLVTTRTHCTMLPESRPSANGVGADSGQLTSSAHQPCLSCCGASPTTCLRATSIERSEREQGGVSAGSPCMASRHRRARGKRDTMRAKQRSRGGTHCTHPPNSRAIERRRRPAPRVKRSVGAEKVAARFRLTARTFLFSSLSGRQGRASPRAGLPVAAELSLPPSASRPIS